MLVSTSNADLARKDLKKTEKLSKVVEEIKSLLTSLSTVNFDASKLKDMQNEMLQDVLANIRPRNDENSSSVSSTAPQTKHSILLKPEANSENPDTVYTQEPKKEAAEKSAENTSQQGCTDQNWTMLHLFS